MHDIVRYLQTGELPEDGKQAHKLRIQEHVSFRPKN